MRAIWRIIAAVIALAVCAAAPVLAQPPDLMARLDRVIEDKISEMGVPGAIVGLSIPGRVDYVRAVGVADTATGAPMTVDDHTRIGSVTKTFTGTAVLQLVDQGLIALTDPISRYVDNVPNGDQITLDLLGRMRSGLFNYTDDPAFTARLFAESPAGPDAVPVTPADTLAIAFAHPPNFPPGERFEYSNTNTVLLGLVVEKVSGLSLGDYFSQRIFGPLGLAQTSYPPDGRLPEPFAHGYTALPDGTVVDTTLWNPSWAGAAGKIVSTYSDMKVWAAALGRGTLLKADTQAQRVQAMGSVPGVGYGFAIFDVHGWIGHNGDIPGYATVSVYLPEEDATLVVFVNSDVPQDHSAGQLATAITEVATPKHVYRLAD
ncbi:MAG: beta-lactamase family protein [Actinobacteria bacterium]|nr:beta-lactamase family protein [Actinomycetota bacterium]MBS1900316.1 beta-lactamase family protein [Actinomycetota bacterium]